MRIWAKLITEHRIQKDVVQEFSSARPSDLLGWTAIIDILCQTMDMERPVILEKHIRELASFNRTIFRRTDFMDDPFFDLFELEIFPEKKETEQLFYF